MSNTFLYGLRLLRNNKFSYTKSRSFQFDNLPICFCARQAISHRDYNIDITRESKINNKLNYVDKYSFSTSEIETGTLNKNEFERKCNETLDSLCEYFEEIIESSVHLKGCDVAYSDGVLTVHFGDNYGTYVINRQSPNHQIWLSSPVSGPKRYDFVAAKNSWIYRHDNRSLHELLQEEIPNIVKNDVNFFNCANAG